MRTYRKNILSLEGKSGESEYHILPAGLSIGKYALGNNNESFFELIAEKEQLDDFSRVARIRKGKTAKTNTFKNKNKKDKEMLTIDFVYDNKILVECIKLIDTEHYKPNIPQGLFITLSKKEELLGVIVFSKLTYTNPRGRKVFFAEKFRSDEDKIRDFAQKRIGWISRIVIKKEFQNGGYGQFFLTNIDRLLSDMFPNGNLEYIEVMTSWTLDEFKAKVDEKLTNLKDSDLHLKNDFLHRAGFKRVHFDKPSIRNSKRGKGEIKKVVQYYYVKRIAR